MDFARLGFIVDSRPLREAKADVRDVGREARRTGRAAEDMGADFERGARRSERAAGSLASRMGRLRTLAAAAAGAVTAIGATRWAAGGVREARSFNSAMNEVSTLLGDNLSEMDVLQRAARELATTYGGTPTSQAQAFYQAISAGASDAATATALLNTANQLAIGGVTDITTAVGVLSAATNAYAAESLTAADASDILFIGVREGVTTVSELGASLGNVIPLAASAGVSFNELTAGVAALTKQGQSTSVAVTGIRQIIASIIAPTAQAAEEANRLGVAFNADALRQQGLAGFLESVIEAANGSQESLATLFGSVEALNAVLAFSGGAGDALNETLAAMEERAGATATAFGRMADDEAQRLSVAISRLSDRALSFGAVLLSAAVPAMEALADSADFLAENADVLGAAILVLAATRIPAAVTALATMTSGMTLATAASGALTAALGGLRVAVTLLGGPWGLLAGLVAAAASYFLVFRDNAGREGGAAGAAYDAAEGTRALNAALRDFYETTAPSAGHAAVALAEDLYEQADAAVYHAQVELARRRAILEASRAANEFPTDPEAALLLGEEMAAAQRAYNEQLEAIARAETAVAEAQLGRNRAARAVTGSTYTLTSALGAANEQLDISIDLAGNLATAASGAASAVDDAKDAVEGMAEAAQQQAIPEIRSLAQAMGSAVGNSEDMGDAVSSAFRRIASTWATEGIEDILMALANGFGFKGPGVKGGGSLIDGIFGGLFGGFRADGGPVRSGHAYVVGERGPEVFVAPTAGNIVPNQALGGGTMGARPEVLVRLSVPQGVSVEEVQQISGDVSVEVVREYDRGLPDRVQQINRDPEGRP